MAALITNNENPTPTINHSIPARIITPQTQTHRKVPLRYKLTQKPLLKQNRTPIPT